MTAIEEQNIKNGSPVILAIGRREDSIYLLEIKDRTELKRKKSINQERVIKQEEC